MAPLKLNKGGTGALTSGWEELFKEVGVEVDFERLGGGMPGVGPALPRLFLCAKYPDGRLTALSLRF